MLKKYLTFILTILVLNLSLSGIAFAGSKEEKIAKFAEKVKTNVAKLGVGKESKVEVKLFNRTKISGYISEITEDGFTLMNEQANSKAEVLYPQVKQIKGNNLSNGVKIAIAFGILLAIVLVLAQVGEGF